LIVQQGAIGDFILACMGTGKEVVDSLNNRNDKNSPDSKDYLAIGVFIAVLIVLAVSAVYLARSTGEEGKRDPTDIVSKWLEDIWQQGKQLLEEKSKLRSRKKWAREVKRHLADGHKLYERKIYQKALQEFDKTIELDPDNFKAYFWRGRVHLKIGQYDKAISDFKMVIKLKPDYTAPYDNLGWLYFRQEKYDESIQYLSKSLELDQNSGWAYYTRGRSYFYKGDLIKALADTKLSCNLGYEKGCEVYQEYKNLAQER